MNDRPATRTTLGRHVIEQQRRHPGATGELSIVLTQIAFAGKIFASALAQAPQAGYLGTTGGTNVQGEATRKLDLFGNQTILDAFARSELVAAIVSEEDDEAKQIACGPNAKYVLCIDPLDGSSNSDVNGVVGTIFGVYRARGGAGGEAGVRSLESGRDQAAAGYIMYGPSTALVYTAGQGAHGFTLARDIGEFVLTHPDIRCPETGKYYSANLANVDGWPSGARRYVASLAGPGDRGRSLRYAGALVADVHRCLLEGGIYLYPSDAQHAQGKLRLLYECAPLAFIAEQAGGAASTGLGPVQEVPIASIHQRVPCAIGSRADVAAYEGFVRGGR